MDNRKDSKPDVLTAAKQTSTSGMNQDGSAACGNDSTDLATIAAALTSIADELHQLNRSLTLTRHDGMEVIGLAQLIAKIGNGRVVRR